VRGRSRPHRGQARPLRGAPSARCGPPWWKTTARPRGAQAPRTRIATSQSSRD
jgi:hypothetical protein